MTGIEMKNALCDIAMRDVENFKEQLSALDKSAAIERKALIIQIKMSENCAGFVKMHTKEIRERRVFAETYRDFWRYRAQYDELSLEEQEVFLAYAFAVWMVEYCLYNQRAEALKALTDDEPMKRFETQLIVGTIEKILGEWKNFYRENGVLVEEVLK